MGYVLAVLLPPVGCILVGKWVIGLLLAFLMVTVIGWPIASIIAVLVVMDAKQEGRHA